MLDLLTGRAHVTITGATFYAVGRDYVDENRVNPLPGIMRHNPIVNRRIVKNLFDAGVVDAAGAAADVLAWDDDQYVAAFTDHRR